MLTNPFFAPRGTIVMLCGAFAFGFASIIYAAFIGSAHRQLAMLLNLASPGVPISAVGVALLRCPLRRMAPVSYTVCGMFHFLIAGGLISYAVWQYRHPA